MRVVIGTAADPSTFKLEGKLLTIGNAGGKTGAQLLPDLAAGRVDLAFVSLATARVAEAVGHAQLLATTSLNRLPEAPALPSVSETLPGFDVVTRVFLLGPQGLPPAVVNRLERASLDTLQVQALSSQQQQQQQQAGTP